MPDAAAGTDTTDAAWWSRRLEYLRGHVAALNTEISKQQAELTRVRSSTIADLRSCESLEAQARSDIREEREASSELEVKLSATARACQENAALEAERRSLLKALGSANAELGRQAVAASERAGLQEDAKKARRRATQSTDDLQRSMKDLGDANADLASQEERERELRRQLRDVIRERLEGLEKVREELVQRLAGRDAEVASWQTRLQESQEEEKRAKEEATWLRKEAERLEKVVGPQHAAEREELRRQLRETATLDERLRDELREACERLWRKEQREREMGGRPWAAWMQDKGAAEAGA